MTFEPPSESPWARAFSMCRALEQVESDAEMPFEFYAWARAALPEARQAAGRAIATAVRDLWVRA